MDLHKVTFRETLTPRDEPYYSNICKLGSIGYRRTQSGSETWLARFTRKDGRYQKKSLGRVDELTHDAAVKLAEAWFALLKGGISTHNTVEEVFKKYVAARRVEKGDRSANDAEAVFTTHLYAMPFGRLKFSELTGDQVETFRNSLITSARSRATVNRLMRRITAAMNWGFKKRLIGSDSPWRTLEKLVGPGAADAARDVFLTTEQVSALLAECGADLAALIRGLDLTGARPFEHSELPAARKYDLDLAQRTLILRHYKGDGSEKIRHVPLSDDAVIFFRELSKDKLPGALLFTKFGRPWHSYEWGIEVRTAIEAANKKIADPGKRLPTATCLYSLRHRRISLWLKAGIGIAQVAKWAGTSVLLVQKSYGKFSVDESVRDRLNQAAAL